jgi:hypothetical protein
MDREKEFDDLLEIIDEKPWLILILMEREPLILHKQQYRHALKLAYSVAKHLRKKENRLGILMSILFSLLAK